MRNQDSLNLLRIEVSGQVLLLAEHLVRVQPAVLGVTVIHFLVSKITKLAKSDSLGHTI